MVKHIVLWKVQDDADKQTNMDRMIEMLTALVGKIEGLVSIEMGYNFNTGSDYDVILYATFKNIAALKYYQNHPEHIKCKDFIGKITVGRTAADYFYEEGIVSAKPFNEVPDVPEEPKETKQNNKTTVFSAPSQPEIEVTTNFPVQSAKIPSEFPAAEPAAPAKQVSTQTNPVSTENQKVIETTSIFGKKKVDVEVTPLEQRSDTWTCPNCGKIMPNYVGTCGCGEVKPFDFGFDDAPAAPLPNITNQSKDAQKMSAEDMSQFNDVQPSLQSYNPQVPVNTPESQQDFSFIKNDSTPKTQSNESNAAVPNDFEPLEPLIFDNAPPPAPMRFDDAPPASFQFSGSNLPPAEPMKFDNTPPAQPMRGNNNPPAQTAPSAEPKKKTEKKHKFGKKAKEEQAFLQAQEAVNNRKDVPNDGTWTCPNCGKVMPKYVGTCGCGESQPFEF